MAKSKAKSRPVAKSAATTKASTLNKTRSKISATQTIPSGGTGEILPPPPRPGVMR